MPFHYLFVGINALGKNYAKNFVKSSRSVMFYTQDSPLLLEFERELRNIFLNHVHSH